MLSPITAASNNRVFANLLAVFLMLVGYFSLQSTTVKLFPTLELETISVVVPYPGATPDEVEEVILEPIEQKVIGLEGIRKVSSIASENLGSVVIELEAGENQIKRLNEVKNQIDQITVFPRDAEEPRVTLAEPEELALQFVVYGKTEIPELKEEADRLRQLLIDQEAISDVRIEAVPDYQINVEISQATLEQYDLSFSDLRQSIASQSLDLTAGEIEGEDRRLLVKIVGEKRDAQSFRQIPVITNENGTIIRLGDIANVKDTLDENPIAGFYDGKPAAVVSIYRVGSQQVFQLVDTAKQVFNSRFINSLSPQIKAEVWRDESQSLRSRVSLLTKNAIIGVLLVVIILMAFLEFRLAMWVAAGLLISFIGSLTLLKLFGYTINQLSLFGFILAIGIVVDDAIVVGENTFRYMEQGLSGKEAAAKGANAVSTPVTVAVMTSVAVFIPLLFIPGIYGQFIGPIAAVVIFVLLLSLIESFFILPRHLSGIDKDKPLPKYLRWTTTLREKTDRGLQHVKDHQIRSAVEFSAKRPITIIGTFLLVFFLTILLIWKGWVKFVFFPEIEGNYVTATIELSNEASQNKTKDVIDQLISTAKKSSEAFSPSDKVDNESIIQGIFATRGSSIGGGEPTSEPQVSAAANLAYITIKIEDASTRNFAAIEFERAWRKETGTIPGAKKLTFSSNLVSAGAPVQLEITSRDQKQQYEASQKLRETLSDQAGVIDVRDDRLNTNDEVQISIKPEALNYGLTLEQLATEIRASLFGAEAVRIQKNREEIEVRIRLTKQERTDLSSLLQKKIKVGDAFIPLSQLAEIEITESPASISRADGKRVITLSADVDTRQTTGGQVSQAMLKQWSEWEKDFPDVNVSLGGDQEEQSRAGPAMARNFILALFAVYTLLALVFNSYSQPLVVMAIIPFGMVGAVLGHWMLGLDLTLLSMFGIIGLSGVVINDSLLLVEFVNEELKTQKDRTQAVTEATLQRFRPIILTSLTTFLGVTPIILETSVQAQFLKPTAVSLGIGVLFATCILIFLLPAVSTLQLKLKSKLS